MITGPAIQFAARVRERGYTLEEVRPCIVREDGDMVTVDETHEAYPRSAKPGASLATKVVTFTAAAARHVAAGLPRATDEQREARWAICQQCPHLEAGKCRLCGCPIVRERQFLSKLAWATESCPVGKWGPAT